MAHARGPSSGEGRAGRFLRAGLAEPVTSRFNERLCLKSKVERDGGGPPVLTSGHHTMGTPVYAGRKSGKDRGEERGSARSCGKDGWLGLGIVVHAFNPSTRKAEAGGSLNSRPAWSE